MLGRRVAEAIRERGPNALVADEVVAVAREADLFVLNLECCINVLSSAALTCSEGREPAPSKSIGLTATTVPPTAAIAPV